MGCGASATINSPLKVVIYGDLLNTDTRNVLTLCELQEIDFAFRSTQKTKTELDMGVTDSFGIDYLSKVTTVLEEDGKKLIGSGV